MTLTFTKMHGLGNDFVVIDGTQQAIQLSPEQIRLLANRHTGIGFDQLLLIEPAQQPAVDFNLRIFNTDGSESGQCGNGARCVGRFIWDNHLSTKTQLLLATAKATLEIVLTAAQLITVNMGIPNFEPALIPFVADKIADSYALTLAKQTLTISVVSLGNPHAVLMVPNVHNAPVATWGPQIAHHPRFPDSANVGFMEIVNPNQLRLRVYERGVGETLACGSGACAAMIIGHSLGLLREKVEVDLPGGALEIAWAGKGTPVWMTGPATTVFKGEWLNW